MLSKIRTSVQHTSVHLKMLDDAVRSKRPLAPSYEHLPHRAPRCDRPVPLHYIRRWLRAGHDCLVPHPTTLKRGKISNDKGMPTEVRAKLERIETPRRSSYVVIGDYRSEPATMPAAAPPAVSVPKYVASAIAHRDVVASGYPRGRGKGWARGTGDQLVIVCPRLLDRGPLVTSKGDTLLGAKVVDVPRLAPKASAQWSAFGAAGEPTRC